MTAVQTHGQRLSLAARRLAFWDAESRKRSLADWELEEVARAKKQVKHDHRRALIRAQAAPPPPRKRKAAR